MIQMGTKLVVLDNSGAKLVECISVMGGTKCKSAGIGHVIAVAVKEADPQSKTVKAGDVCKAIIVTTAYPIHRVDGSYIKFDYNSVVLVGAKGDLLGTRILGPIPREVRATDPRLVSLAPEVL